MGRKLIKSVKLNGYCRMMRSGRYDATDIGETSVQLLPESERELYGRTVNCLYSH